MSLYFNTLTYTIGLVSSLCDHSKGQKRDCRLEHGREYEETLWEQRQKLLIRAKDLILKARDLR
jgi:hypothetical protein